MKPLRSWVFASVPAIFLCIASGNASALDCVVYDLAVGSELIDECLFCGRPPVITPIEGSFVLQALPVGINGQLYSILDIDFHSTGAESPRVYGTGQLHRIAGTSSLDLDVTIDGTDGVHLESGSASDAAEWPAIDITAREDGTRDPLHAFRIKVVAEPSLKTTPYQLQPGNPLDQSGSFLVDDCIGCDRPAYTVPMQGTFLLELVSDGPDPTSRYKIHCLDLESASPDFDYHMLGEGDYSQGGEVALHQIAFLYVAVNGDPTIRLLGSGPFPDGISFPTIDIQLSENDPPPPPVLHFYSLHLVAHPLVEEGTPFRRGDANADGKLDLSDGVFVLLWMFAGGTQPPCLDAADTNGDGRHDVSDAVFVLDFLFRSGGVPPRPGPETCGLGPGPSLGCASYPCAP